MTSVPQTVTTRPGTTASANDATVIPPGYKHTEVGVIPEEWTTRPLRDDIALLSGHHVLARHCNIRGDGTPYLTGPADFPDGQIEQTKYTTNPTTLCKAGDILVTVKGSGSGMLVEADAEYCISRQLMAIRTNTWEPTFLLYSLLQNAWRIKAASTGLIPGLSRSDVLDQTIPLPRDTREQRAIAEALSDVDKLLGSLEKLTAKKRAIKQAAMQQLLTGQVRLTQQLAKSAWGNEVTVIPPGYKQTEVGVIPQDWTVRSLRSCLRSAPDYGINAAAVPFDDGLPTYLRITDISEDNQFRPSPRVSVKHPHMHAFFLRKGDLVFARTGASVGKSYLYTTKDGPLVFAGFLIRMTPDPEMLDPVFLSYCVQSKRYWDWVATMSIRSGQPGINGQEYGTFKIPLPEPSEQRAIATVLSDMDADIAALERRLDKTRAIKQGMMQKLLTGRVRLVKPTRTTEASAC